MHEGDGADDVDGGKSSRRTPLDLEQIHDARGHPCPEGGMVRRLLCLVALSVAATEQTNVSPQRKTEAFRFWSLFLAAVVASLGFSLLFPDRAAACSCAVPEGQSRQEAVEQAFSESEAVFAGQVIALEEPDGPITDSEAPVTVTFRVSEAWKGGVGETLEVTTAVSDASCGYTFEPGESYLVYASGGLSVGTCSETKPLSGANEDLEVLGAGTASGHAGDQYGQPSGEPPAGQPQQPGQTDEPGSGGGSEGECAVPAERLDLRPEYSDLYFTYIPELNGCAQFGEGDTVLPLSLLQANALLWDADTGEELGLLKDLVDLSANTNYISEAFPGSPDPNYSTESYCGAFPTFDGITAQDYHDGAVIAETGSGANAEERAILDPDGDGLACTDDDEAFLAGDDEETGQDDPRCIDGILDRDGDGQISPVEAAQAGADATQGEEPCPGTDGGQEPGDGAGSPSGQTWVGRITQTGEDGAELEYEIKADITPISDMSEDLIGEAVGEVGYDDVGCSGVWVLEEVNEDSVVVEERITDGTDVCAEVVPIILTPLGDGTLEYRTGGDYDGVSTGVLERQGNNAPDGGPDAQPPEDAGPSPDTSGDRETGGAGNGGGNPAGGGDSDDGVPPDGTDDTNIVSNTVNVATQVAGGVQNAAVYCYGTVTDMAGNIRQGQLPDTGGGWTVLLVLGTTLVGGGWLLVRRFSG